MMLWCYRFVHVFTNVHYSLMGWLCSIYPLSIVCNTCFGMFIFAVLKAMPFNNSIIIFICYGTSIDSKARKTYTVYRIHTQNYLSSCIRINLKLIFSAVLTQRLKWICIMSQLHHKCCCQINKNNEISACTQCSVHSAIFSYMKIEGKR